MIEPRPYQKEAVQAILDARKRGVARQLVVLPTGAGKTICFGMLAKALDVPTIVLAHREELLNQAKAKIRMVWPEGDVGILQADRLEGLSSQVCVASVQTVITERRLDALREKNFRLMVVDECFPAGTLVDGTPIEEINVGDEVFSFDHKELAIEKRKVLRVFKQPMCPLVKATLSDGTHLVCTENHPIFVCERGEYVECRNIDAGNHVVRLSPVREENRSLGCSTEGVPEEGGVRFLHEGMWDCLQGETVRHKKTGQKNESVSHCKLRLPMVRGNGVGGDEDSKRFTDGKGICVLLEGVRNEGYGGKFFKNNGHHKQEICFGADEGTEPDEGSGIKSEDVPNTSRVGAQTKREMGERLRNDETPIDADGGTSGVCSRSRIFDSYEPAEGLGVSDVLQGRCGHSILPVGDRGGWEQSYEFKQAGRGPEKGCAFEILRVDRIEIFEQQDHGGNFGNDFVYNLEVEGNNNYFANGILVHNCHHATAESYMRLMGELGFLADDPEKLLVGVTATGYRGDGVALSEAFQEVVFERSIMTMIRAEYLCDAKGISVSTKADLSQVHTRAGDFALNELSDVIDIPERNDLVARSYLEHASGRKGVVFCCDVKHSMHMAESLRKHGVKAEAVYGDMDRDERRVTLERFDTGPLDVLTNCNVLTEGWDAPATSAILLARPTKSPVLYTQMVGRGLRRAPMKTDCLVMDFVDTAGRHSLCSLATLAGNPRVVPKKGETLSEAYDRVEREEEQVERVVKLKPKTAEFELFEKSKFIWSAVGEHFKLSMGKNHDLFAKRVSGGYVPLEFPPEGDVIHLSEDPLPLGYAMGVCEDHCRQYGRSSLAMKNAPWRKNKATEKQLDTLKRLGVQHDPDITAGEASALLQQKLDEPATSKQKYTIRKNGLHPTPDVLTKAHASRLIGQWAKERKGVAL